MHALAAADALGGVKKNGSRFAVEKFSSRNQRAVLFSHSVNSIQRVRIKTV
jgi:hypothetical protein